MHIRNIFAGCLLIALTDFVKNVASTAAVEHYEAEYDKNQEFLYAFNHMVLDKNIKADQHKLYIGALNKLYQLNKDSLTRELSVDTGPTLDNPACHPHSLSQCDKPRSLTDNINKLLLIDYDNNRLVVCGSVLQGICDLYSLNEVTDHLNEFDGVDDYRTDSDYIAANDDLSTVAFIAGHGRNLSMYVGSSKTSKVALDNKFYVDPDLLLTVSKRRIPTNPKDEFMFSSYMLGGRSTSKKQGLYVKEKLSDMGFKVNFIQGFAFSKSGYFVITHENSVSPTDAEEVSYVSQVCLIDFENSFNSYLEIPIVSPSIMKGNRYLYKIANSSTVSEVGSKLLNALRLKHRNRKSLSRNVLFVSFATSDGESAVSVFPMFVVETSFFQLMYDCLTNKRTSNPVLWQQEGNLDCSERSTILTFENMCSNGESKNLWEFDGLRQRKESLKGDVIFESSDIVITSIAVTVIDNLYTAAFLGTADGRILKLKVDGIGSLISPYEVISVDTEKSPYRSIPYHIGQPRILPDMIISEDQSHLYALTQRVAIKIPLQNCSRFSTCDTCLGLNDPTTKDPFCVWCTLENTCRGTGECEASGSRVSKTSCPAITASGPIAMSQYHQDDLLELDASNIPRLSSGDEYQCRFQLSTSDHSVVTANYRYPDTVSCPLPNLNAITLINGQSNVAVSLFHHKTNADFVTTNVTFYKCQSFSSCTQCVDSSFDCHWCIDQDQSRMPTQCRHTSVACQEAFREVTTSEKCPQLEKLTTEYQYIHDGERDKIQIPVQNVDKLGDSDYTCEVHVPGSKPTTYNADRSGNNIECLDVMGDVPSGQSTIEAGITVYWKNNYYIDNPFGIKITMYRCSQAVGGTCGQCLETDKLLKCGWCQSDNSPQKNTCTLCKSCLNEQSCYSPDTNTLKSWLVSGNKSICKHPRITSFEPKSAPINGQTDITVYGENLGLTYNVQLNDVLHIGRYSCGILPTEENNAERVSCRVRSNVKAEYSHNIEFCIREGNNCADPNYRGTSNENFNFVTPIISGFAPLQGYNRGGTRITFKGENLRTGNNINVLIGNSWQCVVDEGLQTDTSFECKVQCIAPPTARGRENVEVSFDGFKTIPSDSFTLLDGILISSVKPVKSIRSGGITTIVQGQHLASIQNLTMVVTLNKKYTYYRQCVSKAADQRECKTPKIEEGGKLGTYELSFMVEDCSSVIPITGEYQTMEYKPDPSLDKFEGVDNVADYSGGTLVITGHNLCANPARCDLKTVKVIIGKIEDNKSCNISSLDSRQIVCQPPEDLTGTHAVKVEIGDYEESLGSLRFKNDTTVILVVVAIAMVFIVLIVIVIIFVYRRRANRNLEAVKELQIRLDMMEAKVAKECKEAFAELQTDMTELDNMSGGGIPFRPYSEYVNRVLFPDPHMFDRLTRAEPSFAMNNGRNIMRTRQSALETFDKLIEDKTFLLTFIRTLERQQGFTIKDRGNVAGLLMIILQDRLQYATEILTSLLKDLIHNSLAGSSHPKLLLRRTESVAEKMLTHWFSVLLFPFLKDCAGDPLYWLFRAIKQQIDKGPVDAVTGEAKYSLSEDKLIRQTVDYKPLILRVIDEDDRTSDPVTVKVLDCDTILQAKEKIIAVLYKNRPFSVHPDPHTFKLQFHRKNGSKIFMSDEDGKNQMDGSWKKLNMLRDYQVIDNSEISLIRIEASAVLNSSFASSDNYLRSGMRNNGSSHRLIQMEQQQSLLRTNQHSRAGTPTIEDDKRIWHLVKPSEDTQEGIGDTGTLSVNKMASEIYLTRLLATKGTIQKFVDDLFETVFTTVQRGHGLPLAIKYMFDFLDEQAQWHNITDQEVVYTWKSNCLPLRFWVNLIKNPHFLFDVDKSPLVDSCLTVIGQTFMDSCSTSDHKLGKDSPSNKLLYAKDIPNYKQWVKKYYEDIHYMEAIRDKDLRDFLRDEFRSSKSDFNSESALMQLYQFVQRFQNEIYSALEAEPTARRNKLKQRLEQVGNTMTSTV